MKTWKLLSLNTCNNPSRVIAGSEPVKWRGNLPYLFCLLLTAYCLLVFFGCASAPPEPLVQESRMEVVSTSIAKDITKREDFSIPIFETDNFSPEDSQAVMWVKLKDISGEHTLRWEWYDPGGNLYFTTGNYKINKDGRLRRYSTIWHKIAIKGEKAGTLPGKWKARVLLDNVDLIASKEFEIKVLAALTPKPPPVEEKLPPLRDDAYAVIIGIDYRNRDDISHLKYPSEDAKKIYDIFTDPKYGGIPKENTTLLLNENATRVRMLSALRSIKNIDGYIYVYYSGHGAPKMKEDKAVDAYLIPSDVSIKDPEIMEDTSITISYLQDIIKQSKAKGVMVALDACFSGGGEKSITVKGGKPLVGMFAPKLIEQTGTERVIITSSAMEEQSWEDDTEIKGGIFSHYLLEGLKGKAGKKAWVVVDELTDYIKGNVIRTARKLKGVAQNPQVSGNGSFTITRNWQRGVVIESAKEKLRIAFSNKVITLEQLNKAIGELDSGTYSKELDLFLDGKIDEKAFGMLY